MIVSASSRCPIGFGWYPSVVQSCRDCPFASASVQRAKWSTSGTRHSLATSRQATMNGARRRFRFSPSPFSGAFSASRGAVIKIGSIPRSSSPSTMALKFFRNSSRVSRGPSFPGST